MVTLVWGPGSGRVIGGVSLVALALGVLIVASGTTGFRLPEWVYFLLLWVGTFGGATANGYRDGGVAASCLAAGIGVLPMALAFAPSGPPAVRPTAVDLLVKAVGATVLVGIVVGGFSHAVGLGARRLRSE
ncbi:hypothetical protein [Halosegnis marinus]|uniref:DUF1097 domain-containing protein n=1 Tax=Halosegnis marinus TaxID=3034023 RepID=A0ABD5ZLW8_9EURY|nr:hypothetical protein [Halosegnis sp. DT85]